ncbi:MAG: sortase family protein [Berkelbacteria bacterium GW2011_GWA2_46_7]|uniref:Sortase family protein n=1 Tax=Berkelbacteria bacterium GW2011_GWA2_46_7 TaxID=1618335 RepID=A0A0G1QET5_9BACT|nr:MAG: sortase family protein [Berkelbacteria bacterium GW2011_GWA2_46_7]
MPLRPVTFDENDLKKIFKSNTPVAKAWRQVRKGLIFCVWFAAIFAVIFYALNAPAFWQRASFVAKDSIKLPLVAPPAPVINYDPEIIISKIGVRAPVIYDASYGQIIERLRNGVVRYEGTANPGQIGNVVIVGHSSDYPWSTGLYKTIFALLDKLTVGDEIVLSHGPNRYVYTVTQTKVVKPTQLEVLGRTPEPTVTLITCYPVGTTLNRLVIVAKLAEGLIGSIQTTEPFLGVKLTSGR